MLPGEVQSIESSLRTRNFAIYAIVTPIPVLSPAKEVHVHDAT